MISANVLELINVSFRYKKRQSFFRHSYFTAVNQVSFNVKKGETLGIIGENGCGKSTLLRVLAGIYRADSGEVKRFCNSVSILSLALGFDARLTGRDNALIGGMLLGARKEKVLQSLDEIIAYSELGHFIDEPIKTYSTGMRARLGFSIALKMKAELLLIDEVMAVGDIKFRKKTEQAMVNKINSDQTVVIVSHSLGYVDKLCNRAIWLHEGEVKQIGASDVVINAYKQYFGSK